ncbi:YihY/virulence factor BrkB family protein [Longimicrobium sp.]|uniref:YihY/virulence factor BrkB family protein n=1 Tax=Longimicrobium sp. TaxID=2029185 RepID=UPI002F94424B
MYIKAGEDDIFFLAGGIAFNVLVAAVPFLLMLIAIFGYVLKAAVNDPQQAAVEYVLSILPPSQRIVSITRSLVGEVVAGRTRFGILGLVLFIWSSTRLVASLRSVLKHIFDLPEERPIIAGMFFDLQMVLVAGTLFVFNTGITVAVEAAQAYGVRWLGLSSYPEVQSVQRALARILAFCFILLMFVLMYRYLPKRKTPWRIALVAAVFTSVSWELLKGIFAWYVTYVSDWRTTYGTLASLILLVFWIYYSAIVFVLGGEVAQVYDLMRIRRKQRELLE